MTILRALVLALLPQAAAGCGAPVCLVDPATLALTRIITFDGTPSNFGPGHPVDDVLVLEGAQFAERFAGQSVIPVGGHDRVEGRALAPLTLMPGSPGQNLSVVSFSGNPMLNGYGVAGYPRREGQGEGAIAVLFDTDQAAFTFDLRGGEQGVATILVLARDGREIGNLAIEPAGEFTLGVLRADGIADMAGFVLTNMDPQGVALDTLCFGMPPEVG